MHVEQLVAERQLSTQYCAALTKSGHSLAGPDCGTQVFEPRHQMQRVPLTVWPAHESHVVRLLQGFVVELQAVETQRQSRHVMSRAPALEPERHELSSAHHPQPERVEHVEHELALPRHESGGAHWFEVKSQSEQLELTLELVPGRHEESSRHHAQPVCAVHVPQPVNEGHGDAQSVERLSQLRHEPAFGPV